METIIGMIQPLASWCKMAKMLSYVRNCSADKDVPSS